MFKGAIVFSNKIFFYHFNKFVHNSWKSTVFLAFFVDKYQWKNKKEVVGGKAVFYHTRLASVTIRIIPIIRHLVRSGLSTADVLTTRTANFKSMLNAQERIIPVSLRYRQLLFAPKYKTFFTGLVQNVLYLNHNL